MRVREKNPHQNSLRSTDFFFLNLNGPMERRKVTEQPSRRSTITSDPDSFKYCKYRTWAAGRTEYYTTKSGRKI